MKTIVTQVQYTDEMDCEHTFKDVESAIDSLSQIDDIDEINVTVTMQEVGTIHSASLWDLDSWEEEFGAEEFLLIDCHI